MGTSLNPGLKADRRAGDNMDYLDARILKALQNDFPLAERPYDILAQNLHVQRSELMERIRRMTAAGIIRRIGLSLDSRRLGCSAALCAVSTPPDLADRASKSINVFPEVTHCYLRDHAFNIWFTIIARDNAEIDAILDRIRAELHLAPSQLLNLPMKRQFKLDARFTPDVRA